jgi:hypothetical protein
MKDLSFHGAAVGPGERGDGHCGGVVSIAQTIVAMGMSQMDVQAIITLALRTDKPVAATLQDRYRWERPMAMAITGAFLLTRPYSRGVNFTGVYTAAQLPNLAEYPRLSGFARRRCLRCSILRMRLTCPADLFTNSYPKVQIFSVYVLNSYCFYDETTSRATSMADLIRGRREHPCP